MHNIGKTPTRIRFSFPKVFKKAPNLLPKVSSEQPPDSFESSEASAKKESWGKRFVSKITSLVKPKPRSVKNDEQGVAEEQIRDVNSETNNSIDKEACEREKVAKTELEEAEKEVKEKRVKAKETYIKSIVRKLESSINQANADMASNKKECFASCWINHDVIGEQRELTLEEQNEQLSEYDAKHDDIVKNTLQQLYIVREKIGPKNYANLLGKLCQNIANVNDNVLPNVIADYKRLIHQILEKAPTEADKKETFNVVLKYMVKCFESSIDQTGEEMVKSKKERKDYITTSDEQVKEGKLDTKVQGKKIGVFDKKYNEIVLKMVQQLSEARENGEIDSESYTHLLEKLCEKIAITNEYRIQNIVPHYKALIIDGILKFSNNEIKKETFKNVFKNMANVINKNEGLNRRAMLIKENQDVEKKLQKYNKMDKQIRKNNEEYKKLSKFHNNYDPNFKQITFKDENNSELDTENVLYTIKTNVLEIYRMIVKNDMGILIKRDMEDSNNDNLSKQVQNPPRRLITDFMTSLNGMNNILYDVVEDLSGKTLTYVKDAYTDKKRDILLAEKQYTDKDEAKDAAEEEFKDKGFKYIENFNKYLLGSIGYLTQVPVQLQGDGQYALDSLYGKQSMDWRNTTTLSPAAAFTKARQCIKNPDWRILPNEDVKNLENNLSESLVKYQKIIDEYTTNVNNVLNNIIENSNIVTYKNDNIIDQDSKKEMKTELQNYTYRLILIAFINFQKIADQDTTNDKRYCASLKHTLNAFIKFYQNKFGTLDGSVNSVYKNCQDWIEKKNLITIMLWMTRLKNNI